MSHVGVDTERSQVCVRMVTQKRHRLDIIVLISRKLKKNSNEHDFFITTTAELDIKCQVV